MQQGRRSLRLGGGCWRDSTLAGIPLTDISERALWSSGWSAFASSPSVLPRSWGDRRIMDLQRQILGRCISRDFVLLGRRRR
jgi:hypothetical protein